MLKLYSSKGLEDHDYTMVGGPATENNRQDLEREIVTGDDQNSVVQDILNAQVIPQDDIVIEETIETQDILTQNSWSPYVTSEEEMVVEDDSKGKHLSYYVNTYLYFYGDFDISHRDYDTFRRFLSFMEIFLNPSLLN